MLSPTYILDCAYNIRFLYRHMTLIRFRCNSWAILFLVYWIVEGAHDGGG